MHVEDLNQRQTTMSLDSCDKLSLSLFSLENLPSHTQILGLSIENEVPNTQTHKLKVSSPATVSDKMFHLASAFVQDPLPFL